LQCLNVVDIVVILTIIIKLFLTYFIDLLDIYLFMRRLYRHSVEIVKLFWSENKFSKILVRSFPFFLSITFLIINQICLTIEMLIKSILYLFKDIAFSFRHNVFVTIHSRKRP